MRLLFKKSLNIGLSPWKEALFLTVMTLVAFIIRQFVHPDLQPDSVSYLTFARNILGGVHHSGDITILKYALPPLYSHLIAWFSMGHLGPADLAAVGRQISILAGSLTVLPVYFLAKRCFGEISAIFAVIFTLLTPELLFYSGAVLTESSAALLVSTFFLCLYIVPVGTGPVVWGFLGGLSLGLAFMTRHAAVGFVVIGLVWITGSFIFHKKKGKSVLVLTLVVFLIGFVVPTVPQSLYNHSETGRFTPLIGPPGDYSLALKKAGQDRRFDASDEEAKAALTPDGTRFQWEVQKSKGILSTFQEDPAAFVSGWFKTVRSGFLKDIYPRSPTKFLIALALIGTAGMAISGKHHQLFYYLWGTLGYYFFLALFHNMRDRYLLLIFPLLVIAAGFGAFCLADLMGKITYRNDSKVMKLLPCGLVALAATIILGLEASNLLKELKGKQTTAFYRDVGKQIAKKIPEGTHIFDRVAQLPYFAGGFRVNSPYAPLEDVIRFGQERDVGYLIVSSWYVPSLRPQYAPLVQAPREYKGMTKIWSLVSGDRWILLYKIPAT